MPPKDRDLQTPWVRTQLIEWLVKLSDQNWQEDNWLSVESNSSNLDDALDFFDDSGVLAEPDGRVGYVLVGDEEVALMNSLNSALDSSISSSASSDEEIIRSQAWLDVVTAAREALKVMSGTPK
ncbi:SCO4402 family protein [Streptomyces sp. OR43]|uniref:SCO4402 family protein n=1 Tax=Streptomyces sp. or43 TaxID=2478957 RepID=UPI0011CDA6FF|nr:hypothetical protein [Streptomyces sp. or43]